MIGPIGLVLIVIIAAIAWAVGQRQHSPARTRWSAPTGAEAASSAAGDADPRHNPRLAASLEQWQAAGLIDARQAEAITAFEAAAMATTAGPHHAAKPRRIPLVAEALGYLGSILGVVGLVALIAKYWPDMATGLRLGIAVGGALLLTVSGFMVPAGDAAFERLRSFVWLGATAAGAAAAGVTAVDVFDATAPGVTALACVATVCLHSALLWRFTVQPLQQLTTLAAVPLAAGLAVHLAAGNGPTGVVAWAVGAALLAVGVTHVGTLPPITSGVGAAALLIGAGFVASDWRSPGSLLLVLSAVAVMALAGTAGTSLTVTDRVVLTVVGGVGLAQSVPMTVSHFASHGGIATGLVVWAAGVALVALADTRVVITPLVARLFGGAAIVGGAAVTGAQSVAFATVFGLCTAAALIVLGTMPERVLMSLFGSLGLLVNVPWAISHFFPGEGRAPLLILVSGMLIVVVAVWLSRQGGRIRHEFRHAGHH